MTLDLLITLVERALDAGAGPWTWQEGGIALTITREGMDDRTGERDGPDTTASFGTIASSMFGQFHLHPEHGAPPFVREGDEVAPGQRVGLIEAMKTFCPIVADRAGRVVAVLAEHGAEVELGQPLFRIA